MVTKNLVMMTNFCHDDKNCQLSHDQIFVIVTKICHATKNQKTERKALIIWCALWSEKYGKCGNEK